MKLSAFILVVLLVACGQETEKEKAKTKTTSPAEDRMTEQQWKDGRAEFKQGCMTPQVMEKMGEITADKMCDCVYDQLYAKYKDAGVEQLRGVLRNQVEMTQLAKSCEDDLK